MSSGKRSNTFSFDDNFVLVLTSPPKLSVQVLDETQEPHKTLLKRLVIIGIVAYKGLSMLVQHYLKS
jgi:hypothetical protein